MEIHLNKELEKKCISSIQQYFTENLGGDIGELKAFLLLRFFTEEIAPSVYNMAIGDAQSFLQEKLGDLENTCFAKEFNHWQPKPKETAARSRGGRS